MSRRSHLTIATLVAAVVFALTLPGPFSAAASAPSPTTDPIPLAASSVPTAPSRADTQSSDADHSSPSSQFSIHSVIPDRTSSGGGGPLTISGTGMVDPVRVKINGVDAPSVSPVRQTPAVYLGGTDKHGLAHLEHTLGRDVSVMNKFSPWAKDSPTAFVDFPSSWVRAMHSRGVIPMLTWNPTYRSASCTKFKSLCSMGLEKIADGQYDDYISAYAQAVKDLGVPLFLRTMHEANGGWYPWNVQQKSDRQLYVRAWRHIHDVFQRVGATNVTWVWCANVRAASGSTSKVPLDSFYPGDDYVDWVALDGYNRKMDRTFDDIFGSSIADLNALTKKPIMVAEIGSDDFGSVQTRNAFLDETFQKSLPQRNPTVRAVLYFMNGDDVALSPGDGASQAFDPKNTNNYYAGRQQANIVDTKIVPLQREESVTVSAPPHAAGGATVEVINGTGETATLPGTVRYVTPPNPWSRWSWWAGAVLLASLVCAATVLVLATRRRRAV